MNRVTPNLWTVLRLLPRTILMLMVLAAPVLAVPMMQGDNGATIEGPALKKKGAGFVLLVSLQRG